MASRKDKHNEGERSKKLKSINLVWRPVTTKATSYEECSSKDIKAHSEAESQVQEVHYSTSTSVSFSNAQNVTEETEAVLEITDQMSSSGLDGIGEDIIVKGESVISTKKHSISVEAAKSRSLNFTHFVSLPLARHPELVEKLVLFKNSILECDDPCLEKNADRDSNADHFENENEAQKIDKGPDVAGELKVDSEKERVKVNITNKPVVNYEPKAKASKSSTLSGMGIDKSIFINPKTFHLTVQMLKLWNKERVDAAAEILQSISSKVMETLDNRPISIRLCGLDCMKGSLTDAHVLYAPVEEIGSEGRLLRACQVIIDEFVKAGLVLEEDANRKLKLHATVMNTSYRKRTKWTRKSQVDSFDARSIFKQYGSEEWGECVIREAHLSQRFVYDDNGYYHCCASIPFPENMQVD